MRRPLFASLLLAALALPACVATPAPRPAATSPGLASIADALFASVEREGTGVGVLVVDAATGETLYARREHARSLPASTMKVVSTAAALSGLGADFRFHTPVWLEGARLGPLFLGDLVVEASGDPSLGSWRFPETSQSCERLADTLLARGITQWHGALQVSGGSPGPYDLYGPGWAWDDAVSVYSAAPTAFVFRENVADLSLTRPEGSACDAPPARPVEVRYTPALDATSTVVVSDPAATRGGVSCVRERGTGHTRCIWRAPGGQCARQASLRVAVDDPQALFTACLDAALEARGIQHVPVPPREARVPGALERELLVDFVSPSLAELVKATNKESLNLYAERLALRFTRERTGTESYAALREALEKELGRRGIPPRLLRAVDGSGLSRYNLATARGMVTVLATSLQEPYTSALVDSLPIAGVDGTLAGSTLRADLRGRVRAKTGTLSGQRAFVGLAERPHDSAHPRLLFALLLSNFDEQPALTTGQVFDRFAEALVLERLSP